MGTLMQDSARVAALQSGFLARQAQLWTSMVGDPSQPVVAGERGDKRFGAKEWRENPYFSYLRQSYLLTSEFLNELAASSTLEPRAKERLQFAVKQWCDAMAPSNFAATNPAVLREAI